VEKEERHTWYTQYYTQEAGDWRAKPLRGGMWRADSSSIHGRHLLPIWSKFGASDFLYYYKEGRRYNNPGGAKMINDACIKGVLMGKKGAQGLPPSPFMSTHKGCSYYY
jgi:hypothetical protein